MALSAPIQLAKSIRWQDPSKFKVMILPTGGTAAGAITVDPDTLTAAITNIQLAEVNSSPIEEWVAEEWRFAVGRLENFQVTVTMKDLENFTLYRMWSSASQKFSREYPKNQRFDILVQTATDFDINTFQDIIKFKDCILVTVGGPTLDNSAGASIAEFSITAKASYIETF